LLTKAPLSLIINRDEYGHATGKVFLDDGYSLDQPYEYYEFNLGAKTLKKWNLTEVTTSVGMDLDEVVITDASDL